MNVDRQTTPRWGAIVGLLTVALGVLSGSFVLVNAGDTAGVYVALAIVGLALVLTFVLLVVEAMRDV